jgi:hypothetical protein
MAFALKSPFRRQATTPAETDRASAADGAAQTERATRTDRAAAPTDGVSRTNGVAETDRAERAGRTAVAPAPSRTRLAAYRGASAVASVIIAIARLVRLATALVVLVIAVAIVLRIASANQSNTIVRDIHDAGRALVGPFKNVFSIRNPKDSIAANWGLAAGVYLIVGLVLAGLIARLAPRPLDPRPTTARPESTV